MTKIRPSEDLQLNEDAGGSFATAKTTYFLNFSEFKHNMVFEQFRRSNISLSISFIFQMGFSLTAVLRALRSYALDPDTLSLLCCFSSILFCFSVGWVSWILLYTLRNTKINSFKHALQTYWLPILENVWIAGSVFALNFMLYIITSENQCYSQSSRKYTLCHDAKGRMPDAWMAFALLFPIVAAVVVKSVKNEVLTVCCIGNLGFSLALMVYFHRTASLDTFLIYVPLYLVLIFEHQRQSLSTFLLIHKLETVETVRDKLEKELQSSVLKHLIGNVAHDLKTVRLLFIT